MKNLMSFLLLFFSLSVVSAQESVKLSVNTEYSYLLEGIPNQKVYAYIELEGAKDNIEKERPPLNLAVVIDKSGSMGSENKLEYVKQACLLIIDNLGENDLLSIVTYDTEVEVLKTAGKIENKEILKTKVSKLQPGSSTNLSGGMLEGFAQAKTNYAEHSVNRVLLLSDGLANQGITDMEELQKIVADKFQNEHIALSTFGVGLDYNEDLMTNLAEYGRGNYYFIEEPDKIPEIFNSELNGLLSVVAQNAVLQLSFEGIPTKMTKLLGFSHKEEGSNFRIDFNDVFSEEKKAILVELSIEDAVAKNAQLEINAQLTFDDVLNGYSRKVVNKKAVLKTTENTVVYQESLNEDVANNKILFLSNEMFEAAVKAVDKNNYEKAEKLLEQNKQFFVESSKKIKFNKEVEDQMNMSNKYLDELDEIKRYTAEQKKRIQKTSKSSNYELRKKKKY